MKAIIYAKNVFLCNIFIENIDSFIFEPKISTSGFKSFKAICVIFPLLLLLLIKLTQPPMLARNNPTPSTPTLLFPKKFSHSHSTEESPRCSPAPNKEKSQLCKRFI